MATTLHYLAQYSEIINTQLEYPLMSPIKLCARAGQPCHDPGQSSRRSFHHIIKWNKNTCVPDTVENMMRMRKAWLANQHGHSGAGLHHFLQNIRAATLWRRLRLQVRRHGLKKLKIKACVLCHCETTWYSCAFGNTAESCGVCGVRYNYYAALPSGMSSRL